MRDDWNETSLCQKWSFPINQYSVFLKQIEALPQIQFKKKLSKSELTDFQVIIYEEEPDLIISFSPNNELKKFVKDLGGKWLDDQFCWHILVDKKQLFLDHVRDKKIKTITYSEPICGKYYYIFLSLFFCIIIIFINI